MIDSTKMILNKANKAKQSNNQAISIQKVDSFELSILSKGHLVLLSKQTYLLG